MTGIEIEGLDEAIEKLENLKDRAKALDGQQEVSLPELFSPKFMHRFTDFASVEAMVEASAWEVEDKKDSAVIPDAE